MPVEKCTKNGKPGYRWGNGGTCYPYTAGDDASQNRAKKKALKQGEAIEISKHRNDPGATKPK